MSADKPEVQRRFIEKFELTFPMLPDTDKRIISDYGARNVLGVAAQRSTFLIAPDGSVAYVWPKVRVEGHADDVVRTLRKVTTRS